MARKTASVAEKTARRSLILDCARPLFASQGQRTAMGDIARAADLSVGTLYLSFPKGKNQIFHALFGEALDKLSEVFDEAFAMPATDTRGRICILLYTYISFFRTENESFRILREGFADGEEILAGDPALREKGRRLLRQLEEPIAEGVRRGVIRSSDTRKTVLTLWGMFDGLLMMKGLSQIPDVSDHFRELYVHGINIILDGLFTD